MLFLAAPAALLGALPLAANTSTAAEADSEPLAVVGLARPPACAWPLAQARALRQALRARGARVLSAGRTARRIEGAPTPGPEVDRALHEAEQAYFSLRPTDAAQAARKALARLLATRPALGGWEQVTRARTVLAAASLALEDTGAARRALMRVLRLDPSFALDGQRWPPALLGVLAEARGALGAEPRATLRVLGEGQVFLDQFPAGTAPRSFTLPHGKYAVALAQGGLVTPPVRVALSEAGASVAPPLALERARAGGCAPPPGTPALDAGSDPALAEKLAARLRARPVLIEAGPPLWWATYGPRRAGVQSAAAMDELAAYLLGAPAGPSLALEAPERGLFWGRTWTWLAAGGALLMAAGGSVLAGATLSAQRDYDRLAASGGRWDEIQVVEARGRRLALFANLALGAAGALGLATLAGWFLEAGE